MLLTTATLTLADVVELPAASRATALTACGPSGTAVVFQLTLYGAAVTAAPTFAPSTLNCTMRTPTLSDACAVTVVVPDTVAPPAGAVIEMAGGVTSVVVNMKSPDI